MCASVYWRHERADIPHYDSKASLWTLNTKRTEFISRIQILLLWNFCRERGARHISQAMRPRQNLRLLVPHTDNSASWLVDSYVCDTIG